MAVENSHYKFPPQSPGYRKHKSYAYRFDTADRSIVFKGDTGPNEAISSLAKGVLRQLAPNSKFGQTCFSQWWPVLPCIVLFEDFGAAVRRPPFRIVLCYRIR
jgi:hypothetical protein